MSLKFVKQAAFVTLLVASSFAPCSVFAQATPTDQARARCATRLSISILGKSPSSDLLASMDPQSSADQLLSDPDFVERFARFINSKFNANPGMTAEQDASYYLTKKILTDGKPWKELFVGPYRVDKDPVSGNVTVFDDPNGLGYFRSLPWLQRYAGNEPQGYKISTAYRIMNNTIGLHLVASTNAPGVDVSTTTRSSNPVCAQCHFNSPFALDKVARVLSQRVGTGDNMTFAAPTEVPQKLFGQDIYDDKQLVTALVNSNDFSFRACRLAFEYLYGRDENSCEGPMFDRCMDAFAADGMIQSAIASVAKDAAFCQ